MKLTTLVFLLAATAAAANALAQDAHVAIFKNVTGSIKVLRSDKELSAVNGMEVFKSDRVISDAGASGAWCQGRDAAHPRRRNRRRDRDYVFERRSQVRLSVYT